jgi:adenylate cyclase
MGIGLHYGPVVLGDIGSERSMAFATIGDTINVSSRLQSLTRDFGARIVASGALVARVTSEGSDPSMLDGMTLKGPQTLRGHHATIEVWVG